MSVVVKSNFTQIRRAAIALLLMQPFVMGSAVFAQSIVPTQGVGGLGTQVAPDVANSQQLNITGGTQAAANLYHSFQQFGLTQGEIANFMSNPSIQNILARVSGGNASVINGLVQVTGGNSNLYLLNPAGIIFGANSSLNVPAAFTATTASGIQVGNGWFGVNTGIDDVKKLTGTPQAFGFASSTVMPTSEQPAAIVNAGNLTAKEGQSITLVGGLVINTGTITSPSGKITIAASADGKYVKITPEGSLLSLQLPIADQNQLAQSNVQAKDLPNLLTGSANLRNMTGLNTDASGNVLVAGTAIPNTAGTAIASGNLDVSSTTAKGGEINVLGDRVGLVAANLNASGAIGGGTVLIGGDLQGKGIVPNAQYTFVSKDSTILADALQNGTGGKVIAWANIQNSFYGKISTQGGVQSGNGGFVEVSGKDTLIFRGNVTTLASNGKTGTLLLDPVNITIQNGNADGDDNGVLTNAFGNNVAGDNGQVLSGDALPTTIFESELEGIAAGTNVLLEASNDITIQPLTTDTFLGFTFALGGSVTFTADADNNGVGNFSMRSTDTINTSSRNLTISGANLNLGIIVASNGNVTLTARNDINTPTQPNNFFTTAISGANVALTSTFGNITTGSIAAYAPNTSVGSISLTANNGNIIVNGFLQAGYTQGVTPLIDSPITVSAGSFRAVNPLTGPANLGNQSVPISLVAYTGGQPNDINTPPPSRRIELTLPNDSQPRIVSGSASDPKIISFTILKDTSFRFAKITPNGAIEPLPSTGSGLEGSIGLGATNIPPNVLVLVSDQSFSSNASLANTLTANTLNSDAIASARTAELQANAGAVQDCEPTGTKKPILNLTASLPSATVTRTAQSSNTTKLPPCKE
jgi:filamentous hemagglutinin family protein